MSTQRRNWFSTPRLKNAGIQPPDCSASISPASPRTPVTPELPRPEPSWPSISVCAALASPSGRTSRAQPARWRGRQSRRWRRSRRYRSADQGMAPDRHRRRHALARRRLAERYAGAVEAFIWNCSATGWRSIRSTSAIHSVEAERY